MRLSTGISRLAGIGATAGVVVGFVLAGTAQAAPTPPFWTCDSHAAVVNLGGPSGATLDPLHANADPTAACADDGTTLPDISLKDVLGTNTATVLSGNAQAQTGLTNGGGPLGRPPASPTGLQAPAALAQIDNTDIALGGQPTGGAVPGTVTSQPPLEITAKAIRSYVSGFCNGPTPVLEDGNPAFPSGKFADGSNVGGQVVDLRINGMAIPAEGQPDAALTQLFQGLSPLAPIIKVQLNQTYKGVDPTTGDTFFRREAVRIELLTAPGSAPLVTIVLGVAQVDYKGDVCASNTNATGTATVPPIFLAGTNEPGSSGGGNGNNGVQTSGGTVVVLGSTATSPNNGRNASECVHLRMFFDFERGGRPHYRGGPKSIISRIGIRRVVRGVIHNCKGQPIIAAKLDVIHIIHGRRHLLKTGLRSRGRGRLTIILPDNLTTRSIEFDYRPFVNRAKVARGGRTRLHITITRH